MKIKLDTIKKIDPYLVIIIILICAYIFLFFSISFVKYYSFEYGNELCVIERYISMMSKGRIFYGILEYEPEFAVRHLYPIFFFFLPIYMIYPTSLSLLFLQTLFLALGSIPVYLLAKKKLNSQFVGLVFAISYLLYPVVQNINMDEYHPITSSITFILFSFYFIDANDFKKSILFVILSLFCNETVVFIVILLGFYTLLKNKNRRLGLTIILLGSLWAFFSLFILFPYTYKTSYFNAWAIRWNYLGDTGTEVFVNFVKNPIHPLTIDLPKKIEYLFGLFFPLGFTSFFDPSTLIIVFHEFILKMTGIDMTTLSSHHSSLIIPFIFISAIQGIEFLFSRFKRKYILHILLLLIIIPTLISNKRFSAFPLIQYPEKLNKTLNFEMSDHNKMMFDIINKIPKNSSLIVSQNKCPQTTHIDKLYLFNSYLVDRKHAYKDVIVEYILFDWNTDPSWTPSEGTKNFFEDISNEYKIVESTDGIILYKHI